MAESREEIIRDDSSDSRSEKNNWIELPYGMAERVRIYAEENGTTVQTVVIEALDTFIREQKKKGI